MFIHACIFLSSSVLLGTVGGSGCGGFVSKRENKDSADVEAISH